MDASVQQHFARIAHAYDRANAVLSLMRDRAWRRRLIDAIARAPAPRILDLCAGTLECTLAALARFPDATVTAVDFSREMLALGEAKLPQAARPRVDIRCADALAIGFPPSSFDAVLCAWGIRNLADKEGIVRRIRGWLRPMGQLLVLDFFRPTQPLEKALFSLFGEHLVPAIGGVITGDAAAYRYLVRSIREGQCVGEFAGFLGQCGFRIQRIRRFSVGPCALVVATPAGEAAAPSQGGPE